MVHLSALLRSETIGLENDHVASELKIYQTITENNHKNTISNIESLLNTYLCMMVTRTPIYMDVTLAFHGKFVYA